MCVGGITWPKNVYARFRAVKNDLRHPCYLAWTKGSRKKHSLRNKKLFKAERASETEEQRKERQRQDWKKIEKEGEPKNYNRKR